MVQYYVMHLIFIVQYRFYTTFFRWNWKYFVTYQLDKIIWPKITIVIYYIGTYFNLISNETDYPLPCLQVIDNI